MPATLQIANVGERLVGLWLAERGYSTNVDMKPLDGAAIEARGPRNNMLIQVRSAVSPNSPPSISPEDERRIKAQAQQMGYEAWEAKVQLNQNSEPVGAIIWRRLA